MRRLPPFVTGKSAPLNAAIDDALTKPITITKARAMGKTMLTQEMADYYAAAAPPLVGPDSNHAAGAIAYTLGVVRPSLQPFQREMADWFKGNLTPVDPALAEIQRRLSERWSKARGPIPADAVAYVIGVDPASPDGGVSVRFLYAREFYNG